MKKAIQWNTFLKVFPLHSDLFVPTVNAPLSDATVQMMKAYMDQTASEEDTFGIVNSQSTNINMFFNAEEGGCFVSCIEYQHHTADAPTKTCVALLIGQAHFSRKKNGGLSLTPYFILTGEHTEYNGADVLIPSTIGCRVNYPNKPESVMIVCDTKEETEISAALCYADDCIKRILAELPLDISAAQTWFENDVDTFEERIEHITTRTIDDIKREIKALKHMSQIQSVTQFHMRAPAGLQ
jgi:hypothetical protein